MLLFLFVTHPALLIIFERRPVFVSIRLGTSLPLSSDESEFFLLFTFSFNFGGTFRMDYRGGGVEKKKMKMATCLRRFLCGW